MAWIKRGDEDTTRRRSCGVSPARRNRHTAWGVLAAGLAITAAATLYMRSSVERIAVQEFLSRTDGLQRMISKRLDDHARILRGGAAFFAASESVTREQWRVFTQHQQVEKQLPGIQGYGFSLLIPRPELARHVREVRAEGFSEYTVKPEGDRDVYSSIVYLQPFSGRNLRAFGYDMFSEPVRRAAMERARDTDSAALSGKVVLVQETEEAVQAGTLMYVPVYRKGLPTATVEQRRAAIQGWVYSPYRMTDLIQGILGDRRLEDKLMHLQVFDGEEPSPQSLLYGASPAAKGSRVPATRFSRQTLIDFNGHRWTLLFTQAGDGALATDYVRVWLTMVGGAVISLLLFALIRTLLNTREKAQRMAEELTVDLQESEQSYRNQFANNSTAMLLIDPAADGAIIDANAAALAFYGYARERLLTLRISDINTLPLPEIRRAMEVVPRGQGRRFEFQHRLADGSLRDVEVSSSSIQFGGRTVMHSMIYDITERKQAEEHVKRQASLINSLLDSIPDIIFFKDVDGVYLGCNPPFAEFVGRTREYIVGKTDYDLFCKETADFFRAHDRAMLAQCEPCHNEEWITYPDGRKVLIDTLKTPYWCPDGKLNGLLGISRDITARHQAQQSLQESETNFRTFFETMTDMIMVGTPEGKLLFANDSVTQTLGYTAEELSHMQLLDLHPPDKQSEAESIFDEMVRGERESCPLPLKRKDGGLVPVDTRVWFGKWNGTECLFGICKNLSAEQEAKQRFERLFRNNPCLMALSSLPDRRFVDVNDAFLITLGYTREEAIGSTSESLGFFLRTDQRDAVAALVTSEGRLSNLELQVRCKDGTVIDGLFSGETISSQGQSYLLSVMINITERKRTEEAFARLSIIQGALMHLATEFVNVPLERQDAAIDQSLATMGQLIHADRAYLFAYDFGAGVMTNTHEWCGEGVTPEIGNLQNVPCALVPDWTEAHRRGALMHIPSVAALPSDSNLRQILEPQGIRSLITLPLTQETACLGFVGFDAVKEERLWRDEEISLLRVLAELYSNFETRRSAERETRELQRHLTQARDAAQGAALAKSLFLANMSHEIRTPLNAILGYAQIMARECRTCPTCLRLNAITRSGEHLLQLLTDLLELVRSDAHTTTLSQNAFDLYQALEDVRLMFVRHPAAEALSLIMSHTPEVPRFICCDSGKVRQILVNLVSNAVKFTKAGSVRLSASTLPDETPGSVMIAVDVEDTGIGIGNTEQERIFDVFEQAENGEKTGKGTGLGLPLSRRYARALGGDVSVTSRLGEGSRFRFTFRARAVGNAAAQLREGSVSRLAPDQRVCRLLVVDDDPASREMLAAMLEPVGFAVETAASAAHALRRLSQDRTVDLVLMDKRMPEMNGYEAIRRLRKIPGGHRLSVLVVTASGFANEREPALAAGADGYIPKPVRRTQLLEEIGRIAGVRYEYESIAAPAAPSAAVPDGDELARLTDEQRGLLSQALRRGDIMGLRELVEAVSHKHAGLSARMRALVDAYDYDRLRRLLESAKEPPK